MTTNMTWVLDTTDYLIISIHNINKNNGDTERIYFDQEKNSNFKSIQNKNTNISYTNEATTMKPYMTTNTTQ